MRTPAILSQPSSTSDYRPSIAAACLIGLMTTVEFSLGGLILRETLLRLDASPGWFALIVALPGVAAMLSMRWLDVLTGSTWRTVVSRLNLLSVSCYGLWLLVDEVFPLVAVFTVLALGQTAAGARIRLHQLHVEGEHFRVTSGLMRFVAGLGRVLMFAAVILVPLLWQNPKLGVGIALASRLSVNWLMWLYTRGGPEPEEVRHDTLHGCPPFLFTPAFMVGPIVYLVWGVFGAVEVNAFAELVPHGAYASARAAQFVGIALGGLILLSAAITRLANTVRGQAWIIAAASAPLFLAWGVGAGSEARMSIFYGVCAAVIAVGMSIADLFIRDAAKEWSQHQSVSAQLFYRYAFGILGAGVGWGINRVFGFAYALPVTGALALLCGVILLRAAAPASEGSGVGTKKPARCDAAG